MWSKREIIIFLAGAQIFHTISHILMALFAEFPIHFSFIVWTQPLNTIAIIINSLISIFLLWYITKK